MNEYDNEVFAQVMSSLRRVRIPPMGEEYDIHALISQQLERSQQQFVHEYKLAPRCRIDFFVSGIGIEVKKSRPARKALLKQLERYARSGALSCIILVCAESIKLPASVCECPVIMFSLNRLWGVALP